MVKATSGLRSHVRMVGNEYVDRLRLGTTPSVIQRYIAGYEARVHVVGDWVFGSRVDAAAVDYRFDEAPVRYQPVDIPPAIASLCREAARSERLELAGLDFRVSADDRWWCLEMNPVPTFLPYEAATGQPIGDAVIDLITGTREHADRSSPLALWMAPAYSEEAAATHDQSRDRRIGPSPGTLRLATIRVLRGTSRPDRQRQRGHRPLRTLEPGPLLIDDLGVRRPVLGCSRRQCPGSSRGNVRCRRSRRAPCLGPQPVAS